MSMDLNVKLGKCQEEIAEFIGFGYSIKETAVLLKKPENTIKSTLKRIYEKAGIQKATELSKFVFCRRFHIPLSMCEPTRQVVAVFFLCLYFFSMSADCNDDVYSRRARRIRAERVTRRIN